MIDEHTLAHSRLDDDGAPVHPPAPASFKVLCWDQADKRAGYPGPGSSNALRFATAAEAEEYGRDLYSRWMGLARYEVQPSDEPVNYRMVDGHAYSLQSLENRSDG